jgi:hypothetical protein
MPKRMLSIVRAAHPVSKGTYPITLFEPRHAFLETLLASRRNGNMAANASTSFSSPTLLLFAVSHLFRSRILIRLQLFFALNFARTLGPKSIPNWRSSSYDLGESRTTFSQSVVP